MKNLKFTTGLFLSLLFLSLLNCSKDDDDTISVVPTNVNSMTLSFNQIPTAVTPEDPGNHSVWFSMIGDNIYYTNPSNTPFSQFMLEYDITNNSFVNKTPDGEVCACGYSSKIISNGSELFYIAGSAVKYSPSTDSWASISYPTEFQDNNGETGVVHFDNKIYFFGGRTATNRFKYYNITTDSWHEAPNGPYESETNEMVVVNQTIYSLGGRNAGELSRFSSYNDSNGWNVLPNLQFELRASYREHSLAAYANRYIFVLNNNEIHVYDIIDNIWKTNAIAMDVSDIDYENIFVNGNKMYLVGKSLSNEFTLYEVNVQI